MSKPIPAKVRMLETVHPDFPFFAPGVVAFKGEIYPVSVNPQGAVSAILENGENLGLKPAEFEVVEWSDRCRLRQKHRWQILPRSHLSPDSVEAISMSLVMLYLCCGAMFAAWAEIESQRKVWEGQPPTCDNPGTWNLVLIGIVFFWFPMLVCLLASLQGGDRDV